VGVAECGIGYENLQHQSRRSEATLEGDVTFVRRPCGRNSAQEQTDTSAVGI
jgi:hypothetical protein